MDLKVKREKELLRHKIFYKTTHILSLIYPPSEDFKLVFKEDMFVKSNKNGFHQVVYYLLSIIDSEKLKKSDVQLPYDSRSENQFRSHVIKFVTELNLSNANANIPPIVMSQLVSPSGSRLIEFLLKLSQFALFEYLQTKSKHASELVLPVKPSVGDSKVNSERLMNLRHITSYVYDKCNIIEADFQNHLIKCKAEATTITVQQAQNSKVYKENQVRLKTLEACRNEKFVNSGFTEVVESLQVKENLDLLKSYSTNINNYNAALSLYLSGTTTHLKHYNDNSLLDNNQQTELDLIELFEKFIKLLDHQRLQIKPLGRPALLEQIERFTNLNQRLTVMKEDVMMSSQGYFKICDKYEDETAQFRSSLDNDTESTPLATPLPKTPPRSPSTS